MAKRTRKVGRAAETPAERVVRVALKLAAKDGWRRTSRADIADAAGLSLAGLYGLYPSKEAILSAFVRAIDEAMLKAGPAEGASARERLFDALMRRFEALAPHKAALASIARDSASDPAAALCGAMRLKRSMAWTLEAAGLSSAGLFGRLRVRGLALIYLATFRTWLADDSPDRSRTMAALDRHLARAERAIGLCRELGARRAKAAA